MGKGRERSSSSSSIDSSSSPSSFSHLNRHLSTDLRLGLGISSSQQDIPSSPREEPSDWARRSVLAEGDECDQATLFVKVYMDGIPIGRKLDLLAHDDYHALIRTLDHMFDATILWADVEIVHSDRYYVLTYEDKEGDWLIVGDVPWEMFLTSVKRLKITRADKF